jgi:hypothetical protein
LSRPPLDASGIAEYIHFECCPKYFKLRFEGEEEKKDRAWAEAFKPISPLLYGAGDKLEERKWRELREGAVKYYDLSFINVDEMGWEKAWEESVRSIQEAIWEQTLTEAKAAPGPILLYQIPLKGSIDAWDVRGKADLIAIWPIDKDAVKIRVFEIKASWKERTYHRVQVAIYALLLSDLVKKLNIRYDIDGGVIYRKSDLKNLDPKNLPSFELGPIIEDVKRLLSQNGELDRIHHCPLPKIEYQLSWKCESCIYNECCFTRAIEGEDIYLLNLSRGEQKALRKHGIEKLVDLARLKLLPDSGKQTPYNFREIRARDSEKVKELSSEHAIGPKLDHIVQRAQFMLHGIRPGNEFANNRSTVPWMTGTGYGNLPEDNPPPGQNINIGFSRGGLIRVYLHVEWDYMLDMVVMISARVSSTIYKGESPSISTIVESLPDQQQQGFELEREMLEGFFRELTVAIQRIASDMGTPEEAPIHLYFYTEMERDRLMDAVRRQPSLLSARAVRDLLGLRQAIDQPMVSIVQDEVIERKALKYHSPGLLPVLEQCYDPREGWFNRNEWVAKHRDGSLVDLRRVFYHGFFNYPSPYRRQNDGSISLMFESGAYRSSDVEGFYPVRAQFGSQIPLEYVWAAKGKLDASSYMGLTRAAIEKCMWRDYPLKRQRITDEDLTLLGSKLCQALEHIERSLNIRNSRLRKMPIDVPRIEKFTLGDTSLDRGCKEYLDLEYFAKRQELYRHYALLPVQRVETGRSVVFECTSVEAHGNDLIVRGRLIYRELGLLNPRQTINACRVKGSDGLSSGDWRVATELRWNENGQLEEIGERYPSRIERSARAIVEQIDPRKLEITIRVLSWPSSRMYGTWHNLPTVDQAKAGKGYVQLFEVGRIYILDELADDIVAERAGECLDHVLHNPLYDALNEFLGGRRRPSRDLNLSKERAEGFLSWLRDRYSVSPKPEQWKFIQNVLSHTKILTLQGPPGTGKTETLQWAVLAHVAAHKHHTRCRVLMVGPTHKAIHEFVSKLAECWKCYCKDGEANLADLMIIRVVSNDCASINQVDGVRYVNYHEDNQAVTEIGNYLMGQSSLDKPIDNLLRPLIVCATPAGMYGFMKKIGADEPPWGSSFFDLLAVDEASMMRLPELILSGAFILSDAQVLLAGDHRQLPPIQAHDWEKEDRRTIEEVAPFLSAQDFIRLLRQEDLGLEHISQPHRADIPVVRLNETHRCHQVVTEYLGKWVYSKDGIDFRSDRTETISAVDAPTEGLHVALKPENVLVLIVHSERESFQSNSAEAEITKALVRQVKNDKIGIITPHNAQRGLLRSELADYCEHVRVDTVERFQGGQSDFIIISATVSDPDYIRAESDFLLNLNRLNVAMSRMKKKLVVIASQSIFEYMPKDAKDYDKAILWRGLLQMVGFTAGKEPDWKGLLSAFLGEAAPDIEVEVYTSS